MLYTFSRSYLIKTSSCKLLLFTAVRIIIYEFPLEILYFIVF